MQCFTHQPVGIGAWIRAGSIHIDRAVDTAAREEMRAMTDRETRNQTKPFLGWQDFARLFDCGRSKALLLMHEVGVVYIGHAVFVPADKLDDYLAEYGSIDITWPLSEKRRKEARHERR